ncbi:MAG TPA: dihydroorotate dehydrogenase [Pseudonocardiaceae bacterium]|nr:dihydroorotate dehydrogenase [Pseudonocardiaceae bacterium]
MSDVWLGDIRLRNRLVTSSSLLGYGAADPGLVPYGMSPISRFVPLERFGAVTTRTLTVQPRDGHFTNRTDWPLRALPSLLRDYATVLRRADAGWINAFGWCNVGIEAYLRHYHPRTREQNTIISVGGFAAEEFACLVDAVNAAVSPGEIAAVELNVSCPNVDHDFEPILDGVLADAVPRSNHPVILKLSPDRDYIGHARRAAAAGVSALTAINTVRALRLDPQTGAPWLANRYGGLSGRAIKPIGLRVVAELRDARIALPVIATGGIRTFDDCREYFWAGADAVSLGSASWLASYPGYLLSPLWGWRIRSLLRRIEGYRPPVRGTQDESTQRHSRAAQPHTLAPDGRSLHLPSGTGDDP